MVGEREGISRGTGMSRVYLSSRVYQRFTEVGVNFLIVMDKKNWILFVSSLYVFAGDLSNGRCYFVLIVLLNKLNVNKLISEFLRLKP